MAKKKGSASYSGIEIRLAGIGLLMVIMFLCGSGKTYRASGKNTEHIAENVRALRTIEEAQTVDIRQEAKKERLAMLDAHGGVMVDDTAEERQKIVSMTEPESMIVKKRFADAAIVGDSIARDAISYKWLDETAVFATIGAHVSACDDLLESAIVKEPSTIFMVFGVNDIERYGKKGNLFISHYMESIQIIRQRLPYTAVYVHAIFPPKDLNIKESYRYLDAYNAALQAMCEEVGVYYIDSTFILQNDPSLYEPDRIHMNRHFYPRWLTYMADMAGLSAE